MPLSYLRDDCHKQTVTHIRESRWFELIYTLQGKTQSTRHMLSTLSPRMVQDHTYPTWSTYSNPLWDADRFGRILLLLRKMAPDIIHSTSADWPVGPYPWVHTQFLFQANQWSNRCKPNSCRWLTIRLTESINTSMWLVRSILAIGGQPIGP
jgi:hypothetical protein